MPLWKKIVRGIALLLVTVFFGCTALLGHFGGDLCAETVIAEIPSPSGAMKALIYQIDCGASTDFNTHVSVMPRDSSLAQESKRVFGGGSFFLADRNHGKAPAGPGGGPEVMLRWMSDGEIEIQHHDLARVFRKNASADGVDIKYISFGDGGGVRASEAGKK